MSANAEVVGVRQEARHDAESEATGALFPEGHDEHVGERVEKEHRKKHRHRHCRQRSTQRLPGKQHARSHWRVSPKSIQSFGSTVTATPSPKPNASASVAGRSAISLDPDGRRTTQRVTGPRKDRPSNVPRSPGSAARSAGVKRTRSGLNARRAGPSVRSDKSARSRPSSAANIASTRPSPRRSDRAGNDRSVLRHQLWVKRPQQAVDRGSDLVTCNPGVGSCGPDSFPGRLEAGAGVVTLIRSVTD